MLTFYPSSAICHGDRAAADLCRRGVAEADPGGAVPAITPVVNVSASWPGASASDVAEAIAARWRPSSTASIICCMESTSSDEGRTA